ncbi:circadian clock-controlled protein daywake [Monomorium pharaonis]|uniref:circadian clock-controlled protein daywake n=1 Tax=Monomorium pharaonis TaxID=307658 RepID=UPI00063EE54B|nr:circadian clock-controlled protein daywake [Monomorium pharaonis]
MCTSIIHICVVYAFLAVTFAEIPPYMKICNRKDPEINTCVLNSIEQLRGKLKTGIPELEVPAIEPLILKHVRLARGPQAARLDVNLTNIQVFGPSTFKIRDLKIDPDNVLITFKVAFQKLDFRGKYKINAQILLLRLVGEGGLTGSFFGYECDCLLRSHKIVKNNNTYINFEKMKFDIMINKATVHLDNLFGGDPILGAASNEVINANSHLLIDEIKPVLENALSELFTNIANKITGKFTYDDLFPIDK